MDRLPQELLCLVVQNIEHGNADALRSSRLVNKALSAAATPLLFEVVTVWIGVRSLERLTAISEHPQLSRYPRNIIFSPVRFIDYEDDNLYRDKVKNLPEHRFGSPNRSALLLAKHMSVYRSCIEMQRQLSLNALDVAILAKAFSQLPRLSNLDFDNDGPWIGGEELIRSFGTFKATDLLTCDCYHTYQVLVEAMAASPIKFKSFLFGHIEGTSDIYSSLEHHSRAITGLSPGPTLTAGESLPSRPACMLSQALSETICAKHMWICKDAFCGLRGFRTGEIWVEDDEALTGVANAFRYLMLSAPGLETVTLVDIEYTAENRLLTLDNLVPSEGLTNIKTLYIECHETSIEFLNDFFGRHGHTIVEVDFWRLKIAGSDWVKALVALRALDFPLLTRFALHYCDGEHGSLQVQDYLLKKTDENPMAGE